MAPSTRYAKKHTKARQRRRLTAHERLTRDRRQAQHAAEALHQALQDLGLPKHLGAAIEGRFRSPHKLLGTLCGVMLPALCGCRPPSAWCRVRGWDKPWPARMLGAVPTRSWRKRLRRLGLDVLAPLWRQVAPKSPATQSRWQWTWGRDDSVCNKDGKQLRWVGHWWSGQHKRVLSGLDGLLLLVVMGDGRLVIPVDFALRRPEPVGPGAPCRDKRRGARGRLDACWAAWGRRGVQWPAPMVVAESWLSDSKRRQDGGAQQHGTLLVEGNQSYPFLLADGHKVKGCDVIQGPGWPWRPSPWEAGVFSVRLRATSPTYGPVTIVIVDEPGQERFSLRGVETTLSAPPLLRRWRRRPWMALVFRTLKHLLATEACQVHRDNAYYGPLVLRLIGSFILFYTSRVICTGRLTMEEIIFCRKHYWRFVNLEALE